MFLADPDQTAFDLRFRLFRTFVRVHPLFWLFTGILGWSLVNHPRLPGNGLIDLALWIACCFVSILLHEFGHVFAFRAFGNDAHILLYSFGGLAMADGTSPRRWQRIVVSVAGPAIQLALWAVLKGLERAGADQSFAESLPREWAKMPGLLLNELLFINLYWPLLNLLPVWPLDGGQISREVCQGTSRRQGTVVSLWISLIVSAGLAIYSLLPANLQRIPYLPAGGMLTTILFAMLAAGSYQAIQEEQSRQRGWKEEWPWDR